MGRERYWGGRSTKRAREGGEGDSTPSSGCMSAVFQFFDFHHFQLCIHHQQPSFQPHSFIPEDPTILKGVEAPRNSLELEDASMGAASLLSPILMNEEENLNIPRGIQIKTSSGATRPKVVGSHDLSSESTYSPGTKTPNLVARLMGLDLLPDNYSPSLSSSLNYTPPHHPLRKSPSQYFPSTTHHNCLLDNHITATVGTRSLPETPRISSARRSDVDHHRLSLQINKENISVSSEDQLECFSRYSNSSSMMGKRKEVNKRGNNDENKCPSHYARQIVKQVKESVSRKAGTDITNTMRNKEQRRDGQIMAIKLKKSSKVGEELPSCSPRVRFLELKNKSSSTKDQISSQSPKPILSPLSSTDTNQSQFVKVSSKPKQEPKQKPIQKCKNFKKTIQNKQEEPFVRPSTATRANVSEKKCKKSTPLSNGLLNITTVPTRTLLPVKKDHSPPATKLPQKQSQAPDAPVSNSNSQLSNCESEKYKQKATHMLTARDDDNNNDSSNISNKSSSSSTNGIGGAAEFQYVTRILKRTGIEKDTPVSFSRWFSPSHPLDPLIFHHLEHSFSTTNEMFSGQLSRLCNRKLIFNLADEILVGILKPYINMKPWVVCSTDSIFLHHDHHMKGSQLIENLCTKIRGFPLANCQVLPDIDALIDKDLQQQQKPSSTAFEEEGEGIVMEIEREIMDSLVQETVEVVWNVRTEMLLM